MIQSRFFQLIAAAFVLLQGQALAQVVGTYDNFDCFNDTGEETEGFEIDIEDVNCPQNREDPAGANCDLTRVFPSNFSTTPWVIRYGLPSITSYDFTAATPDPAHSYDAGHKGVLVTYAAQAVWDSAHSKWSWVASQGNAVAQGAPGVAGNGTPYNQKPTITAGDSCWWYGLGASYPTSGCDHFGISFASAARPGKISYHWKIPDPANPGTDPKNPVTLVNFGAEPSLPPSPTFTLGAGGAVQAVAQGIDDAPEARFGTAYFVKVTTTYGAQRAVLENLQGEVLKKIPAKKIVTYHVLQKPPAGGGGAEIEDQENDNVPVNDAQVTKQYQYFYFAGLIDGESGEAYCDTAYRTQADAIAGTNAIASGDSCTIAGNYWVSPSGSPIYVKSNMGRYIGRHINAANVQ